MATKKKSPKPAPADDKQKNAEADKPAAEKWLLVPSNPIDGGNDIAVGIRIKSAMLPGSASGGTPPAEAKVELKWNDTSIATIAIALPEPALDMIRKGEPIQISTRIKIAAKPKESVKGILRVVLTIAGHDDQMQPANLEITGNDNASMNNGQMVLQVQTAKSIVEGSDMILARSLAPSPQLKENKLREISGAWSSPSGGSPTTLITMSVAAPQLLSDDVFLAFNFTPTRPSLLGISWAYDNGKGDTQRLSATAFLPPLTNS